MEGEGKGDWVRSGDGGNHGTEKGTGVKGIEVGSYVF